jgi:alpha-amylase/alpha-mannosidase (GH57 family)
MDWLRDSLVPIFEREAAPLLKDPWLSRDDYINVILDRTMQNVGKFLSDHAIKDLSQEEKVKALKLLGMQRQALLMYTSCGWFFDEISGIETTQVMKYAARAIQLARDVSGIDLEPEYKKRLEAAKSNILEFGNGAQIYDKMVKPAAVDLLRVTAHYAISSIFFKYPKASKIYSYNVESINYELQERVEQKLAIGRVRVLSELTWDDAILNFAVISFEGHYVSCGVQKFTTDEQYKSMSKDINEAFSRSDIPEVIRLMDKHFGDHNYGMWHLFKDEQRRIFKTILDPDLEEIRDTFRQIYSHDYAVMQVMKDLDIPTPDELATIRRSVLNSNIKEALEEANAEKMANVLEEIKRWPYNIDLAGISYIAEKKLETLIQDLKEKPEDLTIIKNANAVAKVIEELQLKPNLWVSQNILFSLSKQQLSGMKAKADNGDEAAKRWLEEFGGLESHLRVRTS